MTITIIERRVKRKGAKWKVWTIPDSQTHQSIESGLNFWATRYTDYSFRARKYKRNEQRRRAGAHGCRRSYAPQ